VDPEGITSPIKQRSLEEKGFEERAARRATAGSHGAAAVVGGRLARWRGTALMLARCRCGAAAGALLMGRRTAESLGRALPGRLNLVLTRSGRVPFEGMQAVTSVGAALELAAGAAVEALMVIGGGELYAQLLPRAQRLHLTEIDTAVEGADTWFPDFDRADWVEISREPHAADARHAYAFDFVELQRR
jgi:dihydrofolate reductase